MMGSKDTFVTIFTDRKCWRQKASDSESRDWQQRSVDVSHKIFFTADPGLGPDCQITMGTDIMDVISEAEPDDSAGLGVLYRVMVEQL